MRRRVVITGLGPVACTGIGVDAFWGALLEGRSGLGPVTGFDPSGFPSRVAGVVPGLDVRAMVPKSYRKATKVMARDIEIAVVAAQLAADDAHLATRASEEGGAGFRITPERTGCQIGAGLIAAEPDELARALVTSLDESGRWDPRRWGTEGGGEGGMNNLPPLWMLKYLPNMLACHVTILHGAEGPSNTILAAHASAVLCAGEGARVIERGDAEVSFAGGAESKVNPLGMMRMCLLGRTAPSDGSGEASDLVRPFDRGATGTVLSEGGGIVVLEEMEHARARGARAYAEVAGFGAAQTAGTGGPHEPGRGLELAVRAALRDAGIGAGEVDAVVPTALGVAANDAAEAASLVEVFGARAGSIPMVTLGPTVGDAVAGHGGLALAAGALCVHHQTLPARRHAGRPEGLDAGGAGSRDASVRHLVVCASGIGGQHAAVVLRRAG